MRFQIFILLPWLMPHYQNLFIMTRSETGRGRNFRGLAKGNKPGLIHLRWDWICSMKPWIRCSDCFTLGNSDQLKVLWGLPDDHPSSFWKPKNSNEWCPGHSKTFGKTFRVSRYLSFVKNLNIQSEFLRDLFIDEKKRKFHRFVAGKRLHHQVLMHCSTHGSQNRWHLLFLHDTMNLTSLRPRTEDTQPTDYREMVPWGQRAVDPSLRIEHEDNLVIE